MHLTRLVTTLAAAALPAAILLAHPAVAQDMRPPMPPADYRGVTDAEGRVYESAPMPDSRPEWRGEWRGEYQGNRGPGISPEYARARADWLAECRHRQGGDGSSRSGFRGGLIGGLLGGLLGHGIAGHEDKTIGTVAGAAVGAVAGAAIDKSEGQNRARDYCEQYLDRYTAAPQPGYGYAQGYQNYQGYGQGYGPVYGYAVPMMMVPAPGRGQPGPAQPCTERRIVTEEWVNVPVRQRIIPRRAPPRRVFHDKRVRLAPDKRIPM